MVVAASSAESQVHAWDLATGALLSSYRSAAAGRNALAALGRHHFAAAQLQRPGGAAGGAVFTWAWHKTQVALRSFPVEPISCLAAAGSGAFLAGGSQSGCLYLWEVASGALLRSWPGHHKAASVLAFSDDDSLLLSGGEDALVHVWPLLRVLDDSGRVGGAAFNGGGGGSLSRGGKDSGELQPIHAWGDHQQAITGLFAGAGGPSAVIVSSSYDHTCKVRPSTSSVPLHDHASPSSRGLLPFSPSFATLLLTLLTSFQIWSLALGALLRSIVFPVGLNCVVLDPGEYALYAGGVDGHIFVTALNFGVPAPASAPVGANGCAGAVPHDMQIDTALIGHNVDGVSLVSASEDCTVRLWDSTSRQLLRTFQHQKGPVTSLLLVPRPAILLQHLAPADQVGKAGNFSTHRSPTVALAMLQKYATATAAGSGASGNQPMAGAQGAPVALRGGVIDNDDSEEDTAEGVTSFGLAAMRRQISQLEQRGSAAALAVEVEHVRADLKRALNNGQQWQQLHQELYGFVVDELLDGVAVAAGPGAGDQDQEGGPSVRPPPSSVHAGAARMANVQ
eukprot:SM000136S00164  [mRNA]  locus=s136:156584:159944:+ [translate_table: standard]